MLQITDKDIKRFWSYVKIRGEDECWSWVGSGDGHGYGSFSLKGWRFKAHRFAFFLKNGSFPKNDGCHSCDNRSCCNPSHVFDGSRKENMQDAKAKNRLFKGTEIYGSRLNAAKVRAVRDLFATGKWTQKKLALEYGVDQSVISDAVTKSSWAHVS